MPPQKKPTAKPTAEPTTSETTAKQTTPPQDKPTAEPTIANTTAEQTTPPQDKPTAEPTIAETAARAPPNWHTDTLRTIVHRALDADKPDIKGALAALAMLAEAEEPTDNTGDIATLLRDARKRAAHAGTHTD